MCRFAMLFLAATLPLCASADRRIGEAEVLILKGRSVEAYRLLSETLRAAEQDDDKSLRRDASIAQGLLHFMLGDQRKARVALEFGLDLARTTTASGPQVKALIALARIDLQQIRYHRAQQRLQDALAASERSGAVRSRIEIQTLLSDLRLRQGDFAQARVFAQQALSAARDTGDRYGIAIGLTALAEIEAHRAAYRSSLTNRREATKLFRELEYLPDVAQSSLEAAIVLFRLGLYDESQEQAREVLELARAVANPLRETRALIHLARVNSRLGRQGKTQEYAQQALDIARARHDYVGEALALTELGKFWIGEPIPEFPLVPSPEVALRYLKAAAGIYRDAGDRAGESQLRLHSGAAYMLANQRRLAARVFDAVVESARGSGDENALWQGLYGGARARQGSEERSRVEKRYAQAVEALERVYSRTAGLESHFRSAFIGDKRVVYEDYVDFLTAGDSGSTSSVAEATAFGVSELARSRQFAEMLTLSGVERALAANPELEALWNRERQLRQASAQAMSALVSTAPDELRQLSALKDRLDDLERELAEVRRTIAREFPRFAELAQPRRLKVVDVQRVLRADEALLSYFSTRDVLIAFVITAKSFEVKRLAVPRVELRRLVDDFRLIFSQLQDATQLLDWSPAAAFALHERVFAPLVAALGRANTLVVAGDDALYTIPFEALVRAQAARSAGIGTGGAIFREYADLQWLGDQYAIAYVPSAAVFRSMRDRKPTGRRWSASVVAFADPDFGGGRIESGSRGFGAMTGSLVSRATGVTSLARLPETADEARAIARSVGGRSQILLRREASEARLRTTDLKSARYLVFSTHGLLGGDFTGLAEPAIVLSLVGNPPGVDGFLTMSEVLALEIDADLVLLSACNTAGEPKHARGGEGFAGLTRSFAYSGARSLLVSHWPVGSQATVALMTQFFKELSAGYSKPLALQRAQRALRRVVQDGLQLAHPFFWAPFVLVGEPG